MKRVSSIDITRGIVMIIMALDHTRDLLHVSSITQSPTDLTKTTAAVFFTRWITHICAPTFVFLSGTSAWLSFSAKNDLNASRKFLISRGIWLIIVEFTLVNFGLWFDIHFRVFISDIIAAIGFGFIVLGIFLNAKPRTLGIAGLIIIFCHDLFPLIPFAKDSIIGNILTPLFFPQSYQLSAARNLVIAYPPIPWLGIMLVGFACGKFFMMETEKRKKMFLQLGIGALALFLILRFINIYGDPNRWSAQKNGLFSFLSFINITKYPPSLLFCLVTLGIMFLMLRLTENLTNRFAKITTVYGRVPLFYFIVHWYILHPILFAMVFLQGFTSKDLVFGFNFGRPQQGSGLSLGMVYLVWIGVVILMYPLCKWYGNYKLNHKEKKWLGYL
ncbi:MAG TPA: heparan-alpha-glucosaminide N-acetyltransferase domain-containing protein [Puia sp.]|nr:heparan-alpha-glucosaminide N-acetyltransferase domain-containing protein [Puia sp.]